LYSFNAIHRKWRCGMERRRLRNRVIKALTLARRAAVPDDGPRIRKMSVALRLEWYARDIHPWDCDLPAERRAELFTAALMAETIAAIRQTFERLAEVDEVEIRVLAPNEPDKPDKTVLTGTVCRDDLSAAQACPSPAMSLKLLGIRPH
jgi:hypothetical protein